jgi:ABC-type polysaccharide/polyol phosphate export permease
MVPGGWKFILAVNPFAWFVLSYQRILILGQAPSPLLWLGITGAALSLFLAGERFFTWAKRVAMDYV